MKRIAMWLTLAALMPVAAAAQMTTETPDAQHAMLAGLAGKWTVAQSLWLDGATTPKVDSGTADFAMVLRDRHLRQTLRIDDGTGFEGLGYIGYDGGEGGFFTTWMDVNFPGIVVARGNCDLAAGACTFIGALPGSPAVPVRETLTLPDRDHMRYEFYETRGGAEALAVRLDYSRQR
jgi:hypothetical protein